MPDRYAIGVDVGGTSLKYGLADSAGRLIYFSRMSMKGVASCEEAMSAISAAIMECRMLAAGENFDVCGAGIGFPGIVREGVVLGGADNLPGFINVPLEKALSASTGLPVTSDNDANMMGWGELIYGAAKGATDALFFTVGTGIGGAMVINGQLYGGYANRGGELGHVIIEKGGRPCNCGASGCLEAYASVPALVHRYMQLKAPAGKTGQADEGSVPSPSGAASATSGDLSGGSPGWDFSGDAFPEVDGRLIAGNYLAGEPEAVKTLEWHFDYLATGIAGFVNVFSPQKVVIGGGLADAGDFYVRAIRDRVKRIAMKDAVEETEVLKAELGNWAGCLGCCGRAFGAFG